MTDQHENGRSKDTVSDEEWARVLGEAGEESTVATSGCEQGKARDLGTSDGQVGENKGVDTYKVGYGKPPKHTQFKKGRSGNPKGRPKAKAEPESLRDMRRLFWDAAMTPVTTTVGGKRTTRPALDAMYLKLFALAMEGHGPSIRFVHTIARETMSEHEEWQVVFYEQAQELIKDLKNQPSDKIDANTIVLFNELMERVNASPTDKV